MTLGPGTSLGHYEILGPLGKGGMGEVHRARDAKLGREVAIKVLPAEFSQDAERLARLEREARMLAALNHPNIAAIHGLEESDGTRFLVLELVEGDTLADRLKSGAIPIEKSLPLALQIAEALEAAHEKGVIHRDLKPANIKITPDGRVKVLDFGLAKAIIGEKADVDLSHSPTLSMAATQAGIILGTAAYMSPEQASGEVADHRSDIWSFGVVLFEILTGRQLFTGKTASHVMGAVLERQPDWNLLPATLHPLVRETLERCLEKETKNRWQAIGDVRLVLEKATKEPGRGIAAQPVRVPSGQSTPTLVAIAVLAALVSSVATWLFLPSPETERHGVVRVPFILPEGQILTGLPGQAVDITPDGRMIAYSADNQVYVKRLNEEEPQLVQGLDPGAFIPNLSPDGLSIVYLTQVQGGWHLKRIPVSGGTPVELWEGANATAPEWNWDDTIFFSQPEGVFQIPATGGEPVLVVPAEEGEVLGSPRLLPTGDLMFTSAAAGVQDWDAGRIFVQSIGSDERTLVWEGGGDGRYVSTGHLVYAQGDALFALRFDPDAREVTGGATSVVDSILRSANAFTPTGHYAISDNGTFVQVTPFGIAQVEESVLAFADREGNLDPIDLPTGAYGHPRLSPDGTRIAFQVDERDGRSEIWIYDRDGRSQPVQLTQGGNNSRPIWSHDSQYVTFTSTRAPTPGIWWQRADGSEDAVQLTEGVNGEHWPDAWSPDGDALIFSRFATTTDADIRVFRPADGGEPEVFVETLSGGGAFSPRGDWVAYRAARNADDLLEVQVYVQPFPEGGPERSVSRTNGGVYSIFASENELIYRRQAAIAGGPPQNELVSVDISITDDGRITYGAERVLPIQGLPARFGIRDFDILPGDDQILVMLPVSATEAGQAVRQEIKIVLNWFDELSERVPVP